jgi:cytochrome c-type biogenesis protein CcsB
VTSTQIMLGGLSDNAIRWATVLAALSLLAYAAQWAYSRERATSDVDARAANRSLVGAGAPVDTVDQPRGGAGSGDSVVRGSSVDDLGSDEPGAVAVRRRADLFGRLGFNLLAVTGLVLLAGVVLRGVAAGRVPWSNMYEFATAGSAGIMCLYLIVRKRLKLTWLGFPLISFILVVLMLADLLLYTPVSGLIPALKSYWLAIHVTAAVTATAIFSLGGVITVAQLVKARAERHGSAALSRLPSSVKMEAVAYRLHAFAFPIWTFAMIAGAVWAQHAWGRFWGWDPKETWMFITWVAYAAYLHARSTPGWRGRIPWVALIAYGCLLFNLIGVNVFITGLHSYAGV